MTEVPFSIANQLRYGFVLLVILTLLLTSGTLIYLSFQTQLQQLEALQQERSHDAASTINAYLDDLQRKLSYLARVPGLTELAPDVQQALLEGLNRHNKAYETLSIVDRTGQVVIVHDLEPAGESKQVGDNLADSPAFLRSFRQQEDFVSSFETEPLTNQPVMSLAVPIRNQQDQVDGILLAQVDLSFLWTIVSQIEVGERGYAYVIDNRYFLIAKQGDTSETFNLIDISERPFIQDLTLGTLEPLTSYQGLKGGQVLGAIAPIRLARWNVVLELPTSEAYAPIRYMLWVMGIALIVATVIAVGLGYFFSQQIVVPLQHLTAAAAQLSAGDLETQVKISRHNELGVLATTFNKMATQMRDLISSLEQRLAELKQAQKALQESEEGLRLVVQNMPVMMDAFDADGNIIVWNRESTQVTGYDADEMVSNPQALERLYPDAAYRQRIMAILTEERDAYRDKEWEITCQDGSTKTVAWSNISPQFPIPGWASWAIGVDVTERKQAKEQIQASLKEKEVLLKEIHHRVKNNLQIISSLLYLQSEDIEDKATRQMFKDSQNRVKSMALIHEQLYQTDNLAKIDLAEYIERLTNHLSRSWRANHISLQLKIEPLFLTIETAIPCGLIINELVTNAMKYAFPGGEGGQIWVQMQAGDDNQLTLSVKDNGVGFPADINFRRPRSLGLTLVTTLVKQIKGTIELQREHGTEFKIQFPDKER